MSYHPTDCIGGHPWWDEKAERWRDCTDTDDDIVDAEIVEDGPTFHGHDEPLEYADDNTIIATMADGREIEVGLVPATQVAPANTIIPSAIQQLREFLVTLDDGRARMEEEGDVEGLSNGAADILLLTGDLSTIAKDARLGIARVLDEEWFASGKMKVNEKTGRPSRLPELEVENLGLVKVEGGSERKGWESEKLLRKIIMAQVVDPETEELISYDHPTELAERICEVLISVLPVTGSLAWKVGSFDKKTQTFSGLRGLGIEPEDFCDEIVKTRIANVPKRHGESE